MSGSARLGGVRYALSDWQAAVLRPWDDGVYERSAPAGPYACWSGRTWRRDAPTPDAAARQVAPSVHPATPWRGLAEPSGRPCLACRGHGIVDLGVDDDTGADRLHECPECG